MIAAAGLFSRTDGFNPMMNMDPVSAIRRIAATLHRAGIGRTVLVTGPGAAALERQLAGLGIIFLRCGGPAEDAADAVKTGLAYLREKCSRVLLAPADRALFTAATVEALLNTAAPLAFPTCHGQQGFPVLLSADLIPQILADGGPGGLRSILDRLPLSPVPVPVSDPGILPGTDAGEDFDALLQAHSRQLTRPQVCVSLVRELPFFDEKVAMLLELVDEAKSVRTACQRMQISYSTGWNILRATESQFSHPLVIRSQGGIRGGQSVLTEYGRCLLERYRAFREELEETAETLYQRYFENMF